MSERYQPTGEDWRPGEDWQDRAERLQGARDSELTSADLAEITARQYEAEAWASNNGVWRYVPGSEQQEQLLARAQAERALAARLRGEKPEQ